MRFKARSFRQGHWFKVLERQERGLIDSTIRWVSIVKSERLGRILTGILSKLVAAIESPLSALLEKGRQKAFHLSELAVRWGNGSAWIWRFDDGFQAFLGIGVIGCPAPGGSRQASMSNR